MGKFLPLGQYFLMIIVGMLYFLKHSLTAPPTHQPRIPQLNGPCDEYQGKIRPGTTVFVVLNGLVSNNVYELRISWPATVLRLFKA